VALEALGCDSRITMHRQEHRVVRKSRDVVVVSRRAIGGEKKVEQGAKNTALGDTGPHLVAVRSHAFIPYLEVTVGKVRLQEQIVWAWEGVLHFIQQVDVPHFVKRLGDVQESRGAQCAFLKACHDLIDNTMHLLDRRVAGSKTKLVAGNEVGKFHIEPESL